MIPFRGRVEWLEAEDLLDELCEDQLALSMSLTALERSVGAGGASSGCAVAALRSIDERLGDLRNLRDALAALQVATFPSCVHRTLLQDSPLSDYLRGVYAWGQAVVRAMSSLVSELGHRGGAPAWETYRWRIEQAQNFHFHELAEPIRTDIAALPAAGSDVHSAERLEAAFESLLARALCLDAELEAGLGGAVVSAPVG